MKNLRNKNQPPDSNLIQTYLSSSWDIVTSVYEALDDIQEIADALEAGEIDGVLQETDIDTIAKLNVIVTDATMGDFASEAEAVAGTSNTKTMTPLRVAQYVTGGGGGLQNNYVGTTAPGVSNDSSEGYSAGSLWFNVTADPDETYRCTNPAVGAAVWIKTSLTADELATVAVSGDSDDLIQGSTQLLMTVAERSKLLGIEASATADMTGAEIKVAYELEANTNAFTDAEKSKLGVVETGATADQSNAEIRTAVEAATDSNVFTDADHTKLGTIEDSATADQSDAEIKTAYQTEVPLISQGDAEAGIATAIESFSALRVAQAIAALGASGGGMTWLVKQAGYTLNDGEAVVFETLASSAQADFPAAAVGATVMCYNNDDASNVLTQTSIGGKINIKGSLQAETITLAPGEGAYFTCSDAGTPDVWEAVLFGEPTEISQDVIWDTAGDIVQATGANAAVKLAIGTALQQLRVNAGATALEYFTDAGGGGMTVEFKTASFTAAASIIYKVDSTGGAVVVTLPAGNDADHIIIQDVGHSASIFNITVNPDGAETIDDDTTFIIDQNDGDIDIGYKNADTNWEVSADGFNLAVVGPVKTRTVRTLIETIDNSATAGDFDFNNIASEYDRLIIRGNIRGDVAGTLEETVCYLNADTTAGNYNAQHNHAFNASNFATESATAIVAYGSAAGSPASDYTQIECVIEEPNSAHNKLIMSRYTANVDTNQQRVGMSAVTSIITAAITRVRIQTDNDPTDELFGILTLYGEKDEDIGGGTGFDSINDQTGVTYEFVVGDIAAAVVANNAAASTYDIPDGYADAGATLTVYNKGAGAVTIEMAGTDTLDSSDNTCEQYKAVTLLKIATTVWTVIGGSA